MRGFDSQLGLRLRRLDAPRAAIGYHARTATTGAGVERLPRSGAARRSSQWGLPRRGAVSEAALMRFVSHRHPAQRRRLAAFGKHGDARFAGSALPFILLAMLAAALSHMGD